MQKEERRIVAEKHTEEMEKRFHKEILHSAQKSRFYTGGVTEAFFRMRSICITNWVKNQDVGTAIEESKMKYPESKTAVLNFASYKEPGGRFINGSMAQEEALCHASALYNVLKCFPSYYEWNRQFLNRALYLNRGIYSPEVPFVFGGSMVKCDVITVAAPNKNAAQKYCKVTNEENSLVLRGRIRFVLDIAEANQVDTLILGAYGCGVFGQDPTEVAEIFRELLESGKYGFRRVVFPIPASKDGNLAAFQEVFNKIRLGGEKETEKSKIMIEANDKAEFVGQVIDLFEDFLEERGISLKNEEKNGLAAAGEDPEQEAIIYGADYDQLQAGIEELLENWGLVNNESKMLTPNTTPDIM